MKHSQTYDHYFLYEDIEKILKQYETNYPEYTKLDILGVTKEGRNIYLMEITDLSTGDFNEKPAYYIEANMHAGEVTGSMVAMYLIDTLLTNKEDENISKILKKTTFYVLPRVTPDGAQLYLTTSQSVRSINKIYPFESQMPGLIPEDLDHDGVIRMMRVKTPYGIWKKSPLDDRLFTLREMDDDEGEFYNVYQEGKIIDYDGLSIHHAPDQYGFDFNRNYPIGWRNEWEQEGSGDAPLSEIETKANSNFLFTHLNICAAVDLHTCGGMVIYTPGFKKMKEVNPQDMKLEKAIAKIASDETGFVLLNSFEDYSADGDICYGAFDDFCHFNIGVPALTVECWDLTKKAGANDQKGFNDERTQKEKEEKQYKILKWMDENLTKEEGFKDWTPFNHPQLGEVEIGGICHKYTSQNPPISLLEEEMERHMKYMLRTAKTFPHVVFDEIKANKIAEDIYKLEVIIGNRGCMPSYVFNEGLKNKRMKELSITLSDCEIIEGKQEMKIGHLQGYFATHAMMWGLPGMSMEGEPSRKKVTWIIKAKEGTTLHLVAKGDRIGKVETTYTL